MNPKCYFCGEDSEPTILIDKLGERFCHKCYSPKIGECEECREIGYLKKDVLGTLVCEECYDIHYYNGDYDKQD